METRASYVMVGLFVLTLIVGLLSFVVWTSRVDWETGSLYVIYFKGSVAGLRENERVTYNGVPIGNVVKIDVDPQKVNLIRVRVEIDHPSLIRENSFATLEAKGITGQVQIKIHGSTPDSPILLAKESVKYAEIHSQLSSFQQVIDEAPKIMEKIIKLVNDVTPVFDEDNRKAFANMLIKFSTFSETLADESENMKKLIVETKDSVQQFKKTMQEIESLAAENRPAIKRFTDTGLQDISGFVNEWRKVAKNLNRITTKFERNPVNFLFYTGQDGQVIQD